MTTWRIALFVLLTQVPAPQPSRSGASSVEGVVVQLGTNEPIAGVDLELTDATPQQAFRTRLRELHPHPPLQRSLPRQLRSRQNPETMDDSSSGVCRPEPTSLWRHGSAGRMSGRVWPARSSRTRSGISTRRGRAEERTSNRNGAGRNHHRTRV